MDDISKKDKLFSLSFLFNTYLFFVRPCWGRGGVGGVIPLVRRFPSFFAMLKFFALLCN